MNTFANSQAINSIEIGRSRSIGTKFLILCALVAGMSLSGFYIDGMADSRASAHGATTTWQDGKEVPPHTVLGMKMVDSYRSTERSIHYITLFLGLVFLTYFIFEVTSAKGVHPGQYALVGIAQTIFYLLLLSLAELVGFDWAYLIASGSTVMLFALNASWIFVSRELGVRALAVFTALYGFIYVLLRMENYALLVGSVASFAIVAATMYFTRNVDWYGVGGIHTPVVAGAAGATAARESWLE